MVKKEVAWWKNNSFDNVDVETVKKIPMDLKDKINQEVVTGYGGRET